MAGNSTGQYDGHDYQLYKYSPSVPAAVVFTLIFAILAVLHTYYLFKNKGWYWIPFTLGVIFEAIGYAGRIAGHYYPYSLAWYILQAVFILIGPTVFAASIYMTLSRIAIALHSEELLIIRPKWLTIIFVCGDLLSLNTQSGGAGLLAKDDPKTVDIGQKIVTGGLLIQILFFGAFILVTLLFHRRLHASPAHHADLARGRKYLYVMYAANTFILVRSIFRVAEYVMPHDGPLLSTEVYLYIFDATLMTLTVVVYLIVKPYGELFDEWKRRKDLGDLELSRRDRSGHAYTASTDIELEAGSDRSLREPPRKPDDRI
ncbi:hypothetical protein TWF696_003355 [Orbilia brochopaga]|uniref:RTA1-domain-containing protein n=1 Tax=Orbilia brochopaga TaxID=3140254 RepID=A0AAV9TZM0_9PEZI